MLEAKCQDGQLLSIQNGPIHLLDLPTAADWPELGPRGARSRDAQHQCCIRSGHLRHAPLNTSSIGSPVLGEHTFFQVAKDPRRRLELAVQFRDDQSPPTAERLRAINFILKLARLGCEERSLEEFDLPRGAPNT